MRRLTLSCTNVSFMPRLFAPPQPKHLFDGFGANVIVSVKFSQPLFSLYPITSSLRLLKRARRGSARRGGRLAGACASRHAKYPPVSPRRERFAFRPDRHSREAANSTADSGRRNNEPVQTGSCFIWR